MTERPYDIITFDCYGTLIDWERGIRDAFSATAAATGFPVDPDRAIALYVEIEAAVEAGPYQSYRAVLTETARRITAQLGWPLSESHAGFLADSVPAWPPFPDTNPALRRLADAGYRLGILSNVDDDLLAWTRRHLAAFFEIVVTAQHAGSYKPAPRHFTIARDLIGSARWLHAAQSYFHDVVPARALGIPVAWINRKGEAARDGGKPAHECHTLTDLADWLAPQPGSRLNDRLYQSAETEMDPAKRAAPFIRMNDLVIRNAVVTPVRWRNAVSAVNRALRPDLSGWDPNPWLPDWHRQVSGPTVAHRFAGARVETAPGDRPAAGGPGA